MSVAPCAQPLGCRPDRGEIVALGRQPQQRQAAVGMARTQPVERALRALERRGEGVRRDAFAADALGARVVDRLA